MDPFIARALKAAETKRKKAGKASDRAKLANITRRLPWHIAQKTEAASREALVKWAKQEGWFLLFLDDGRPRTGIVDALLVRHARGDADELEVRLVQLKAGSGALAPEERERLDEACSKLAVAPAVAY